MAVVAVALKLINPGSIPTVVSATPTENGWAALTVISGSRTLRNRPYLAVWEAQGLGAATYLRPGAGLGDWKIATATQAWKIVQGYEGDMNVWASWPEPGAKFTLVLLPL